MCPSTPDLPEPKDNEDYNAQSEELVIRDDDDNRSKTATSKRRGTQSLTVGLNAEGKQKTGAGLTV